MSSAFNIRRLAPGSFRISEGIAREVSQRHSVIPRGGEKQMVKFQIDGFCTLEPRGINLMEGDDEQEAESRDDDELLQFVLQEDAYEDSAGRTTFPERPRFPVQPPAPKKIRKRTIVAPERYRQELDGRKLEF